MGKYAWKGLVKADKLDEYMSDMLIMEKDSVTGAQPLMRCVFSFD